jgi:putative ABC transport system permease protein
MFRREWRQQTLVLALIVVALAATVIGAAVATDTPPPAGAGFGTAQDMATFPKAGPQLASQIAALQQRFGRSAPRCSRWSPGTTRPGRGRWP